MGNTVSWCDKLASVPSGGLRFNHRYVPVELIVARWHPILDAVADDGQQNFQLQRHSDFSFDVHTDEGFKYGCDPSRVHCGFQHRMKLRNVSGSTPNVEMLSTAQPFTMLLPEVLKRTVDAAMLLPDIKDRNFFRAGVTSTTWVDDADLPPGLARFLEYLGRPWQGLTGGFSVQLTANIGSTKSWTDRCIHTLLRSEHGDEVMTVQFDFQRTYENPRPVTREALVEVCKEVEAASLEYFEALAEGNMFDGAEREADATA